MKAIKLINVLIVTILFGCASTQKDYIRAKDENTIQAFTEFLNKHPDSKFKDEVKTKINEIQIMKEVLFKKLDEINKRKFEKIQKYEIGILTEEQFFKDNWNANDPWLGTIGIFKLNRTYLQPGSFESTLHPNLPENKTVVALGICDVENESKADNAARMFLFSKFSKNANFSMTKETKEYISKKGIYVPSKDLSIYACILVFHDGLLYNKKMSNNDYTTFQKNIHSLLDQNYWVEDFIY